jgi:hypothetical protein
MMDVKRVDGRRKQLLDDLRNRRKYWKVKEGAEDRKGGNESLLHEHMEEIQVIVRMEEGKRAFKILTGNPIGKRPLGRHSRRWEDNIR